jgi:tRNA dimethylallyltransferase
VTLPGPTVELDRRPPGTAPPLALVGPTASGKTEASIDLATRLGAEIVLIDSMTVYRGMDIGTAKPSLRERALVPHHLVDAVDPAEPFSVAAFQGLARDAVDAIRDRGRAPLLVGGSGLYYRAVVDDLVFPGTDPEVRRPLETEAAAVGSARLHARLADLDPAAAAKMEPSNERRVVRALEVAGLTGRPFSSFAEAWGRYPERRVRAAGLRLSPEDLRARIESRVARQFEEGFVEEVRDLLDRGLGSVLTASQAIGYLEVAEHLAGRLTVGEARARIVHRTRALARRQLAWFRRDPRIRWFEAGPAGAVSIVDELEEHLRG